MATLVVAEGVLNGNKFKIPGETIISVGRDDECTIQILDPTVSRKHLQLRQVGNGHICGDYRSANGVTINGSRLVKEHELSHGDRISLGDTTLIYSVHDDANADSFPDDKRGRGEWGRSTIMRD